MEVFLTVFSLLVLLSVSFRRCYLFALTCPWLVSFVHLLLRAFTLLKSIRESLVRLSGLLGVHFLGCVCVCFSCQYLFVTASL